MTIEIMTKKDRDTVIQMMQVFYNSPAVHTNGSMEIFENDVNACINANPYLEGYVFIDNGKTLGYAMLAKSFSTEFGKPCVWVEDIYIQGEYRGMGIGSQFLQYIFNKYPNAVIRLEAEEENERAVSVYKKNGFEKLPYLEMIKL